MITEPTDSDRTGIAPLESSPQIPLYARIREGLKARILDGTYPPHGRLPSESRLMSEFGVSRITVRQALQDLQNQNLIFSVQGKGSFVSKPKAVQDLTQLEGLGEAMNPKGYEALSRVTGIRELPASKPIRAVLELEGGASVMEIRRVRHLNRQPLSLDVSYFPLEIGVRLMREDLATRDVFSLLENELGLELGDADCQIDAIVADEDLSRALAVVVGAPILRVERLTRTRDGRPIDFEHLYIRGDAYRYRVRVRRTRRNEGVKP